MHKITDILKDKLKGFEYGYTTAYELGVSNTNNKHTKATKSLNSTITFNKKIKRSKFWDRDFKPII